MDARSTKPDAVVTLGERICPADDVSAGMMMMMMNTTGFKPTIQL